MRRVLSIILIAASAPIAAVTPPSPPTSPAPLSLAALKHLETGLWQLDVYGRPSRQLCVSDPIALVQIEHDQPGCSRFVVSNEAKSATVHYSCQRAGWGRTTVRVETPRAVTIQTQGIARKAPFEYSVQAKRVGACGTQLSSRSR